MLGSGKSTEREKTGPWGDREKKSRWPLGTGEEEEEDQALFSAEH